MENRNQLQVESNWLLSKSIFIKKEIDFLVKIIQKEYDNSLKLAKSEILDNYWFKVQSSIQKLNTLTQKIQNFSSNSSAAKGPSQEEIDSIELGNIENEVRSMKESFFDFLNPRKGLKINVLNGKDNQ